MLRHGPLCLSHCLLPGVLAVEGVKPSEVAPIPVAAAPADPEEVSALGYPEIQGDMAPSALVPKACEALTKFTTKVDVLLVGFQKAADLTPLQVRTDALDWLYELLVIEFRMFLRVYHSLFSWN